MVAMMKYITMVMVLAITISNALYTKWTPQYKKTNIFSTLSTVNVPFSFESELNCGDYPNVKIHKLNTVSKSENGNIGEYYIQATIKSKEMNTFLLEYKNELKKRKVIFPGFRPGNIPPYAMADIRKYLVCFGLENYIGDLCNINGLKMCKENGEDVQFGTDAYYQEIIQRDSRGYDFEQQRDAWKEGMDFHWAAKFFAESEDESNGSDEISLDEIEISSDLNVVDTSAIEIEPGLTPNDEP